MNKKIASEIAIGIILILTIVIGGIFWLQSKKGKQQPAVNNQIPQPAINQQQSADETIDWQTYKNNKLGFEINIPKDANNGPIKNIEKDDSVWFFLEKDDNKEAEQQFDNNLISEFKRVDGISWAIIVKTVNNDKELDKFIKDRYGKDCKLGEKTPSEKTGTFDVAIDTGEIKEAGDGCFINWMLFIKYSPENHKVAAWDIGQDISFVSENKKNTDGTVVSYDFDMAKSFKFIDAASEIANWQTYTNDKYGFEFKYPKDWETNTVPEPVTEDDVCYGQTTPCNSLQPKKQKSCGNVEGGGYGCLDNINFGIIKNEKKLQFINFIEKENGLTKESGLLKDNSIQKEKFGNGFIYKFTESSAFDGLPIPNFWVTLDDGNFFQMAGSYLDADETKIFNQIISTFKFTK